MAVPEWRNPKDSSEWIKSPSYNILGTNYLTVMIDIVTTRDISKVPVEEIQRKRTHKLCNCLLTAFNQVVP